VNDKDYKQAFSLVELSIVLVILGLLTGGILTGQNLIRAAELRSVMTEFQSYQTAAMTFRDKYFAIPGDMRNATDFWGSAGGSGVLGDGCEAASGTDKQTCNGNGDGMVLTSDAEATEYTERFAVWQHLVNAGLIAGSYTGKAGAESGSDADLSVNIPASKFTPGGWEAVHLNPVVGHSKLFDGLYPNSFKFGAESATGGLGTAILTPEEAWNIDTKLDDGRPGYGSIIAVFWNDLCPSADDGTSSSDDLDASYRLSDSTAQCALWFRNAF
jgi:prepilin-type N-terminal cleavage/methylation domain-containing protein